MLVKHFILYPMNTLELLHLYPREKDQLMLMLHAIQHNNVCNNITPDDIKQVATYLNTTQGFVYGVVSYYSMFSLKPRGKYLIRFCKSPLCRMIGAQDLLKVLEEELQIHAGQSTPDGMFTLEYSECLGHCDKAPVLMLNDKIHVDLNESALVDMIRDIRYQEQEI